MPTDTPARRVPAIFAVQDRSKFSPMPPAPPFEPSDGPAYRYAQLADYLEERIRSGDLAPGSRLRGEQALREEYEVALGTLRKALGLLRDKGLLVTTPSLGTFVVKEIPEEK
jgi:DNA-binding GntR family transcriptional regulator